MTSTAFFQVPLAWGALIVLSLIGIVLFQVVVIVERVFFPWAVDADKQTVIEEVDMMPSSRATIIRGGRLLDAGARIAPSAPTS